MQVKVKISVSGVPLTKRFYIATFSDKYSCFGNKELVNIREVTGIEMEFKYQLSIIYSSTID